MDRKTAKRGMFFLVVFLFFLLMVLSVGNSVWTYTQKNPTCNKFINLPNNTRDCGVVMVDDPRTAFYVLGKVIKATSSSFLLQTKDGNHRPVVQKFTYLQKPNKVGVTTVTSADFLGTDPRGWHTTVYANAQTKDVLPFNEDALIVVLHPSKITPLVKEFSAHERLCLSYGAKWASWLQRPSMTGFLTLFLQKYLLGCGVITSAIYL